MSENNAYCRMSDIVDLLYILFHVYLENPDEEDRWDLPEDRRERLRSPAEERRTAQVYIIL
jgi:hypothetical protein